MYKHGKIKHLSSLEAKPSLFRFLVPPPQGDTNKEYVSVLIKLYVSKLERVTKIPQRQLKKICPIDYTNGFLDVAVIEEIFKLSKDH